MFRYNRIFIFFTLFLLSSCNSYKSITSKYNILYNGELFLNEGINQLRDSYKENFWDIIPVIKDNNIINNLPDYPTKNFLKSEEKGIKVIQKMGNSQNADSKYINEAYLLLGKSRFFDKRYISALQAFNYLIKQDEKSDLWIEAFYWKNLININLEQFELAILSIENFLKSDLIEKKYKAKLYSLISEAYFKKKEYKNLINSLNNLINYSIDNEEIRRSKFIVGQTYLKLNKKDSAYIYFNEALNLKASKFSDIYLDSQLKISEIKYDEYDSEYYKIKLNQPRNLQSKAKINYYYAKNTLSKGDLNNAIPIFKNALKENGDDENLDRIIYEELFNINLSSKDYLTANNYLDTLISKTDNSTKNFFLLNKKREKLKIVTDLEKQNKLIDSLLYLSSLDKESLKNILQNDIKSNNLEKIKLNNSSLNQKGAFYFNNSIAINNGKKEFNRIWGKRQRVDNWRTSSLNIINYKNEDINLSNKQTQLGSNKFIKTFVPYSELQKDSLIRILNTNYYKKGVYLFEYFNDYQNSLKSLLKIKKEKVKIDEYLQSRYYLFKIYSSDSLKNAKKANDIKEFFIQDYPKSIYFKNLSNNGEKQQTKSQIENYLENLRLKLDNKKTNMALKSIDSILPLTNSRPNRYNLLLFKYETEAKSKGINYYLKSLKDLTTMFPDLSNALKEKITLIEKLQKGNSMLISDESYVSFLALNKDIDLENLFEDELEVIDYDSSYNLIPFYGFQSEDKAIDYMDSIIIKYKRLSNNKYFVLSTPQYINMLIFKSLDKLKK